MGRSGSQNRRSTFKISAGAVTGKRRLGRPKHIWEDNFRMDFKDIYINTRNLVDSAEDRDYWKASGFHKPWSYLIILL